MGANMVLKRLHLAHVAASSGCINRLLDKQVNDWMQSLAHDALQVVLCIALYKMVHDNMWHDQHLEQTCRWWCCSLALSQQLCLFSLSGGLNGGSLLQDGIFFRFLLRCPAD